METVLQILFSGCAVGMIYAVIAFGYQLTFATSQTLNFGQGEALAIGALFGLTLTSFMNYWVMIPVVLLFGACYSPATSITFTCWWSSASTPSCSSAWTPERAHVVLDLDYIVAVPRQPLAR